MAERLLVAELIAHVGALEPVDDTGLVLKAAVPSRHAVTAHLEMGRRSFSKSPSKHPQLLLKCADTS